METVCIIGGGFSGCLTAIHLLNQSKDIRVVLLNSIHPVLLGIAYNTSQAEHLLNVPAAKMSVFPNEPLHFVNWLTKQADYSTLTTTELEKQYVPRILYGSYLKETLSPLLLDDRLNIVNAMAQGIEKFNESYKITLDNDTFVSAEHIVLALGNSLPAPPKIKNTSFFNCNNYCANPWDYSFLKKIQPHENVLLIGTGLTMVDCVLSLNKQGFKGNITALSPKGYAPASHTKTAPWPDFTDKFKNKSLLEILKTVRQQLDLATQSNIPWQSVIDSIRPQVSTIWQELSDKDKQQFISHLRHIWGVARHRLPEAIHKCLEDLKSYNQLHIIAGRIQNMHEEKNQIQVDVLLKNSGTPRQMYFTKIINCTGPQANYAEIKTPFIENIIRNQIAQPHPLKMGLLANSLGQVLDNNGNPVPKVYTIGSLLRGVLWETTAVPEIRQQAENVATQIAQKRN